MIKTYILSNLSENMRFWVKSRRRLYFKWERTKVRECLKYKLQRRVSAKAYVL